MATDDVKTKVGISGQKAKDNGRVGFYRKSMAVLAIIFFIAGILFLTIPDPLVKMINYAANVSDSFKEAPVISELPIDGAWNNQYINERGGTPMDHMVTHRLWVVLGFTMMMMITLICVMNWINPYKYYVWTPLLIFAKACSSLTGLLVFQFLRTSYVADLTIFFVDFPLFLFTLIVYLVARGALKEGAEV